ncbi:MAG TPA: PIG-L deacetylase family protein [Acidimicrobiia bacterium]|jgi:LmbE family N-acetylglucosaminyl deacetylase|nr:PIG-L deacetylase family protein [Acidimicrobiia bacterium]
MLRESDVERILVVTAHPDDVDFGSAGTVAGWTDAGIEVAYCICTSGEAGGFDRSVPRATMVEIREAEQLAAAKVVGVSDVTFLRHPDGRLSATFDLRRDISRVIRRVRPQRVVGPSPERNFERLYASHPDHLAAGEATMAAVYPDARNPFAHPELLEEGWEPWAVDEMYVVAANPSDVFVDITDTFERKLDALRCHVSQMTDLDGLDARIRGWNAANAALGGLPEGRLAESYLRVDTQ